MYTFTKRGCSAHFVRRWFHSEARWLSRGKEPSWVFELREEIWVFLNTNWILRVLLRFSDQQFLMKLAYLCHIFGKLNEWNLQLQGRDKQLPHQRIHSKAWAVGQATWWRKYFPATSVIPWHLFPDMAFSAVASLKTKYRSKFHIELDLKVEGLQPHFEIDVQCKTGSWQTLMQW